MQFVLCYPWRKHYQNGWAVTPSYASFAEGEYIKNALVLEVEWSRKMNFNVSLA